jgi:hypothetical protein
MVQAVPALVAPSVYTHANWSVDTKDMAVHLVPGLRVHVKPEAVCKLFSSLTVYFGPGNAFSYDDGLGTVEFRTSAFRHLGGFAAGSQ